MTRQEYLSPLTEGLAKQAARRTPQSAPFDPLSWVHVIQQLDPDTEELESDQALSEAALESAASRHGE